MAELVVTVLMPVYNGRQYLREAIESILTQSYRNFEFIIINDGSTDDSEEIILSYTDNRIKYIKNEKNIKLIATLNNGLAMAAGKYIARMDADDISLPQRLERQVAFMESNPEMTLAGTWFESIGDIARVVKYESDINLIRFKMLYQTQFCHPSVIVRRSIIDQIPVLFDPAYIHAEDYELFSRIAYTYQVGNLPEVLLRYRVHQSNVSVLYKNTQIENSRKVMVSNFAALGILATCKQVDLFEKLAYQNYAELAGQLNVLEDLLLKMIAASPENKAIAHPFLFNHATRAWFNTCYNLIGRAPDIRSVFYQSPITKQFIGQKDKLRFMLKSILVN